MTGYTGAFDWTRDEPAPVDDGIFLVEMASGKKRLLISFRQLADAIAPVQPKVRGKHLFINHTLWNRNDDRIYFYVRGDFDSRTERLNVPCTIRPDGTGLTLHKQFIGGHPEWESGPVIIGSADRKQVLYNVDEQRIVGHIGTPEMIPDPEGDCSLSPDGKWLVNGYRVGRENRYVIVRRTDGSYVQTQGLPVDGWTGGDLRLDAAPCWNRASSAIAVPAIAGDATRSRQTFILRIRKK